MYKVFRKIKGPLIKRNLSLTFGKLLYRREDLPGIIRLM